MIITCRECGLDREKAKATGNICCACSKEYQRAYRKKHKDRLTVYYAERLAEYQKDGKWFEAQRKRGREYWQKLRHETIMAYGGYKCACCGETEPKFLTIDHIFNDGSAHRKTFGTGICKWLKDHGFPSGFQILCMNCNHGKAQNGGICPHKAQSVHENCVKTGEAQTG